MAKRFRYELTFSTIDPEEVIEWAETLVLGEDESEAALEIASLTPQDVTRDPIYFRSRLSEWLTEIGFPEIPIPKDPVMHALLVANAMTKRLIPPLTGFATLVELSIQTGGTAYFIPESFTYIEDLRELWTTVNDKEEAALSAARDLLVTYSETVAYLNCAYPL